MKGKSKLAGRGRAKTYEEAHLLSSGEQATRGSQTGLGSGAVLRPWSCGVRARRRGVEGAGSLVDFGTVSERGRGVRAG